MTLLTTTARNSAQVKLACLPRLSQSTDILKAKGIQDVFNLSQRSSSQFIQFIHIHQNTHLTWTSCTKPKYHCKPFIKQDTSSYFKDKQACYFQPVLNCYLTSTYVYFKHLMNYQQCIVALTCYSSSSSGFYRRW